MSGSAAAPRLLMTCFTRAIKQDWRFPIVKDGSVFTTGSTFVNGSLDTFVVAIEGKNPSSCIELLHVTLSIRIGRN